MFWYAIWTSVKVAAVVLPVTTLLTYSDYLSKAGVVGHSLPKLADIGSTT